MSKEISNAVSLHKLIITLRNKGYKITYNDDIIRLEHEKGSATFENLDSLFSFVQGLYFERDYKTLETPIPKA